MLKTFVKAAAIASILALAGCNTTSTPAPSTTNHPPSAEGANPSVNPDGTVKRMYVNR